MKLKNYSKSAVCAVITTTLLASQVVYAVTPAGGALLTSIFDSSNPNATPTNGTPSVGSTNNPSPTRPATAVANPAPGTGKMNIAKVPEQFACPVFDNKPLEELFTAIDALSTQVTSSKECSGDPSAKGLQENGEKIKQNIESLQSIMAMTDPSQVNVGDIEQSLTSALSSAQNIGNILSNNSFVNSACGTQTMTAGKALLAFNDIINGLSPYALFAVSMNAALAPALPFVIGGIVATSGISVIGQMIESNSLDMTNPTTRKALVVNTCQFVKVSKRVRFMQLAQTGKIDQITKELQKSVNLYKAQFDRPTEKLNNLLSLKAAHEKNLATINKQLQSDLTDLRSIEEQFKANNDDLMVCTLGNELAMWANDGKAFPASTIVNLNNVATSSNNTVKLQSTAMKNHFESARKKVLENAQKAIESEDALKSCASAARSWLSGIRQTANLTSNIVKTNQKELESQLNKHADYRHWKAQYVLIENQRKTVERVEKAMKELSQDQSIIDRSELSQRLTSLKSGLFGNGRSMKLGKAPVKAWIDHTRSMYDRTMAAFTRNMNAITNASYSLTPSGKGLSTIYVGPTQFRDPRMEKRDKAVAESLSNFTLKNLPMGSRQNELACQQLENAWIDWTSSLDHLGSIQFFCDMIDTVIDEHMDKSIKSACRGNETIAGKGYIGSIVQMTRDQLVKKGFQKKASIISAKMKELKCPLPSVNVMNN